METVLGSLFCLSIALALVGIIVVITGNFRYLAGKKARLIGLLLLLQLPVYFAISAFLPHDLENNTTAAITTAIAFLIVLLAISIIAYSLSRGEPSRRLNISDNPSCYVCKKAIHDISMPGGMSSGQDFGSIAVSFARLSPYPCKSCGVIFCSDCILALKKRNQKCPSCNQDTGW
jgi:hypothetical protein